MLDLVCRCVVVADNDDYDANKQIGFGNDVIIDEHIRFFVTDEQIR